MAIPTWLCAEDGSRDERGADPDTVDPSDLAVATDIFEVLSDPSRPESLAALHERSTPARPSGARAPSSWP
jgi:hypothetical protein